MQRRAVVYPSSEGPPREWRHRVAAAIALGCLWAACAHAAGGYYRSPAVGENVVVFTAEGDLWSVPLRGGQATRLTTAPGQEHSAHVSPDGKLVAYTADDGTSQAAMVMPISGGAPRRLTFDEPKAIVVGWTPAGEVLYRTDAGRGAAWHRRVVALDPVRLTRKTLPLSDVTDAVFASDGKVLLTRFGLLVTGDNSHRYRGGAMGQLWRWGPGAKEATRLLGNVKASFSHPLRVGDRLVFLSDESGIPNIWSATLDGSGRRQLTHYTDFAVRDPDARGGDIVFQHGADLVRLNAKTSKATKLDIRLVSDHQQTRPRWIHAPLEYMTGATLAPGGQRVALTARGQVTLVAPESTRRVVINVPKGTRLRSAVPGPDGRWVYAIADISGELEIWRLAADGSPERERLTKGAKTQRLGLWLSPDGGTLVHSDAWGRLFALDTRRGTQRLLDDSRKEASRRWQVRQVAFSPDSRHIAFVRPDTKAVRRQIILHRLKDGKRVTLTSDRYPSYAPAFSPDGRWLYFLSDRNFQSSVGSVWGDRNTGPHFEQRVRVYALALQPDAAFRFEAKDAHPPSKPAKGEKKPDSKAPPPPAVFAGIAKRLRVVPVAPGNYLGLAVDGQRLYLLSRATQPSAPSRLETLALKPTAKPVVFATDVVAFEVDAGAKRVFLVRGKKPTARNLSVVPAAGKAAASPSGKIDLAGWRLRVQPRAEWRSMFADAWRMHRDGFYDRKMRGVDWKARRDLFAPLVERAGDRADLDDVLAQMVGALESLHSQVRSRDRRRPVAAPRPGRLGGVFTRVPSGYRVDHLYRGDPDLPSTLGPLLRPAAGVREGDVITAVGGRLFGKSTLGAALLNRAGRKVDLRIRRKGKERVVRVTPISDKRNGMLREQDWQRSRKERVEKASGGRFGYFRLRAMGSRDIAHFVREFYSNQHREGLIIDVRRNLGGNVDSWMIEKLLQKAWMFWQSTDSSRFWNMQSAYRGRVAVLIDELTYSDGETFAAAVRALRIGPLIGRRTAGAGVWLDAWNKLVDRGIARLPEYPQYGRDGRWIIEGIGVSPDIEVENLPQATHAGADAQLEAAIRWLKEHPPKPLPAPRPIPPAGKTAADPGK